MHFVFELMKILHFFCLLLNVTCNFFFHNKSSCYCVLEEFSWCKCADEKQPCNDSKGLKPVVDDLVLVDIFQNLIKVFSPFSTSLLCYWKKKNVAFTYSEITHNNSFSAGRSTIETHFSKILYSQNKNFPWFE